MSKTFERVSFVKLVQLALRHGYPPQLLRHSVASYRWPRYLSDGRLVAPPVQARQRAIVAGSSFATLELKAILLDVLDSLVLQFPETRITIHVDDIAHSSTGLGDASTAARALAFDTELVHRFEYQLRLPFATAKTAVLATSKELARRVAAGLPRSERGAATGAVRNLGYDYALRPNVGGQQRARAARLQSGFAGFVVQPSSSCVAPEPEGSCSQGRFPPRSSGPRLRASRPRLSKPSTVAP